MSHRLQVLLDEEEFEAIRAAARRRRTTVSEYVRQTLREARSREPTVAPERKLSVIREAAAHAYPSADIEQMDAEIQSGYLGDES
ncbi:MAG: antitoxin [Gemmatimonadetes bacterium]|nr:antitoxin [Gemmatimonadota bacterium]NNK62860.1 antitoxin [Gemmatimonadota bacterium]